MSPYLSITIAALSDDVEDNFRWLILGFALASLVLLIAKLVHDIRFRLLTRGDIATRQGLAWALLAIAWSTAENLWSEHLWPIRLELLLLAVFFIFVGLVGNYVGYWMDRKHPRNPESDGSEMPPELRKTGD